MRLVAACLSSVFALSAVSGARGLEVLHVSHAPSILVPGPGKSAQIRFHLSDRARVTLKLYDARDRLVRAISPSQALDAGDQRIGWDGRDGRGRIVPPEAYTYVLEAIGASGELAEWDVTDAAGEPTELVDLAWDPQRGRVAYQLSKNARVRVRIGLGNGGPLLRTLVDWVPRERGFHEEPWDGRDAMEMLDLSKHPGLALTGAAFELPANTIFVGPLPTHSAFLELPAETAVRSPHRNSTTHQMLDFGRQRAEDRRDFKLRLELPKLAKTQEGIAIARATIPVRVEASKEDLARLVDERSEAVFFVDGQFFFERETGFLPITWNWDPSGYAPGAHYLTVNVRGYEGHFGTGTVRVWIEGSPEAKSR